MITGHGDGVDGDGTGDRAALITTMVIGAVGRILIIRRAPITVRDRLCGPTGQATVAIGAIVHPTIGRRIVRGTGPGRAVLEIGQMATAHRRPDPARRTALQDLVRRNRHCRTERRGNRANLAIRTGQDPADPQHPTKPSRHRRIDLPETSRPLSRNLRLRAALSRRRGRLRKRNPRELNRRNNRSQVFNRVPCSGNVSYWNSWFMQSSYRKFLETRG